MHCYQKKKKKKKMYCNFCQNHIVFIVSPIWNKLINHLKILNTTMSYTHNYKKLVSKN